MKANSCAALIALSLGAFLVIGYYLSCQHAGQSPLLRDAQTSTSTLDSLLENDMEGLEAFRENERPVVGIFTQPGLNGLEYIAASYVKYAEAAGARVVPIRYWWSEQKLKAAFKGINGLLMPGGDASIDPADSKLYKAAEVLYREAERSNKLGQRFPIWGTCLGWELMAVLAAKSYNVLSESGKFSHHGVSDVIFKVDRSSSLFKHMDARLLRALEHGKRRLSYFSHQMGVTPEMFNLSLDLKCWKITALGEDTLGKTFVAAAESSCRPYFGVQFHPEKSLFEWYSKAEIPHSALAQDVSRHFIRLLGKELKSARSISQPESWVFENSVHKLGKVVNLGDSYFAQMYVFANHTSTGGSFSLVDSNESLDGEDTSVNVAFAKEVATAQA